MIHNIWFWLHIGFFVAGVLGLCGAVVSAGLYLWQSRQLILKNPGTTFFKLPSLDVLDKAHSRLLGAGIILFSLGMLIGVLWAQQFKEVGCIFKDTKVLLSFVTCFFYWLIFSLRVSALRRGHKISMGTLLAFTLLFWTLLSSHQLSALIDRGSL